MSRGCAHLVLMPFSNEYSPMVRKKLNSPPLSGQLLLCSCLGPAGAVEDRHSHERTGVALVRIPCRSARAILKTGSNAGYFSDYPDE